jgi:hypothetical protein
VAGILEPNLLIGEIEATGKTLVILTNSDLLVNLL